MVYSSKKDAVAGAASAPVPVPTCTTTKSPRAMPSAKTVGVIRRDNEAAERYLIKDGFISLKD